MSWFFALPLEVRLAIVFLFGLLLGTQVNHAVYRFAFHRRSISPWQPRDADGAPRRWFDFLPVVGWLGLARDVKLHGDRFWLRPLVIELLMGVGLALLYWWECGSGLCPPVKDLEGWSEPTALAPLPIAWVHAQFFVQAILIALMAAASFIDIDEKLIPDEITVFGALAGLLLAAALPISRLPEWNNYQPPGWSPGDVLLTVSPLPPPKWLGEVKGLAVGLACFLAWWGAIIPWTCDWRRGPVKGLQLLLASFRRRVWPRPQRPREGSRVYLIVLAIGIFILPLVWGLAEQGRIGRLHWRSLLSALVGMVAGGGLVWAVRIIGGRALGKEAMGFGDVTLVAMIGAFLGWQPCLMLFFIAPFIGVCIALAQWLVTRRQDIWYGPFLCLGALLTIVFWAPLWEYYGRPIFGMGATLPAIVVILLAMMGAMLTIWRYIKERFIFPDEA
ncbi:MAG: prepilin peptidase [Planctomycetales bacterium]|nr:prepilin peptidase [Planctomycetales bacterium]